MYKQQMNDNAAARANANEMDWEVDWQILDGSPNFDQNQIDWLKKMAYRQELEKELD